VKQSKDSAENFVPLSHSLNKLREAASKCKGCELYKRATQTVFGEGSANAEVMFVGEQPGDVEDRDGHPFIGPAGKLLRKLLDEVGLDTKRVYFTNAVKHFNFEERGKRRLHSKPRVIHIEACHPWLEREIEAVEPKIIVCLGATAAYSVLGKRVTIAKVRGTLLQGDFSSKVYVTVHPSSLLRIPDRDDRHAAIAAFRDDLKHIAGLLSADAA
jgi:DNA polymerase